MAIRAFLCPWSETAVPGGIEIHNPINDYFENVSLSDPATVFRFFYARMSQANRPDKLFMLTIIRGNLTNAEWTAIGNISGVRMIPPFSFDKATNTLSNPVKNQINSFLDSMGIPRTVLSSAATVGGFLRNLLAELDPGNVSFGSWETLADEWA